VHFRIPRSIIFRQRYQIFQCLLAYPLGENGHQVEEIYNFLSTDEWVDKISECDIGLKFEGIQSKVFKAYDKKYIYI
jgi:hypothetical protein